jgi:methanogenic corrinoid protein MtbC1
MIEKNESLATILNAGDRTLAAYATNELFASEPNARDDFGASSFEIWHGWLTARLEELAAAIAVNQPQRFADHIHWAKAILAARGIPIDHFRMGLDCLHNTLQKELPSDFHNLAKEYFEYVLEVFDGEYPVTETLLTSGSAYGQMTAAYLLALLEGDRRKASGLILDAVKQGANISGIYQQVLMSAQEEIDRMWVTAEINVAEEHFVSATTKMVMAQIYQHANFKPSNGKTIITAAVDGNQHDIGLQMIADFFEMDGWRVIHLGADIPMPDLLQATEFFHADLLGLSVSSSTQLKALKDTIAAVRELNRDSPLKIIAGGRALANSGDLANQLGADAYAASATEAVAIGNQLVGLPCHE